jgi:hypothetical protein
MSGLIGILVAIVVPWHDYDGAAAKPICPATRFTGQRTIDRRCRSDKDRAKAIPKSKMMREAF